MKNEKLLATILLPFGLFISAYTTIIEPSTVNYKSDSCMVRIAELTLDSTRLDEYLAILKEEAAESIRVEPGVIAIFPMQVADAPDEIRLVEIYASRTAYEAHLQTPHFLTYKSTTLDMVQSLELIDMKAVDPNSMAGIFVKLNNK